MIPRAVEGGSGAAGARTPAGSASARVSPSPAPSSPGRAGARATAELGPRGAAAAPSGPAAWTCPEHGGTSDLAPRHGRSGPVSALTRPFQDVHRRARRPDHALGRPLQRLQGDLVRPYHGGDTVRARPRAAACARRQQSQDRSPAGCAHAAAPAIRRRPSRPTRPRTGSPTSPDGPPPRPPESGSPPRDVPTWRSSPPISTATLCPRARASSRSWVTCMTVAPSSWCTRLSSLCSSEPGRTVQRRERLVEQQHLRLDGQRAGQRHPLLLPAGQTLGIPCSADRRCPAARPAPATPAGRAAPAAAAGYRRLRERPSDRADATADRSRCSRPRSDAGRARSPGRRARRPASPAARAVTSRSPNHTRPSLGPAQSGHGLQQHRLPRRGRAQDHDVLAGSDGQVVDGQREVARPHPQPLQPDHRPPPRPARPLVRRAGARPGSAPGSPGPG